MSGSVEKEKNKLKNKSENFKLNETAKEEKGRDEHDSIPDQPEFDIKLAFIIFIPTLFSIVGFLVDMGMDCFVAYKHYQDGYMWYFGLTITFVIFPMIVMNLLSLKWYLADDKERSLAYENERSLAGDKERSLADDKENEKKVSKLIWTIRILSLILLLGPVLRYIQTLYYCLKLRKHKDDKKKTKHVYHDMVNENSDVAVLGLIESFLEGAPQLVLQIYILSQTNLDQDEMTVLIQKLSCLVSLTFLSWSIVSNQRALRQALVEVRNISWKGTLIQFLWRFLVIGARILALGLFASVFPIHLGGILLFRWVLMTAWVISMKTKYLNKATDFEEKIFNALIGAMFIFSFVYNPQPKDPSRRHYYLYYFYTLFENTILMVVWFYYTDSQFRGEALIAHYVGFFVGLLFMVVYYMVLHPSKDIALFGNGQASGQVRHLLDTKIENGNVEVSIND